MSCHAVYCIHKQHSNSSANSEVMDLDFHIDSALHIKHTGGLTQKSAMSIKISMQNFMRIKTQHKYLLKISVFISCMYKCTTLDFG